MMTERKCRFCGKEIQNTSTVCEHCGRELFPGRVSAVAAEAPPVAITPSHTGRNVVLMVAGGFMVLLIIAALNNAPSEKPVTRAPLQASVRIGALSVEVINKDHQDWTNVRVRLSDKYFCPAKDKIEASKSAVVYLASCTSLNGERFTPATMAPTNVVVTAVLTEDTGEAIAGFAPTR